MFWSQDNGLEEWFFAPDGWSHWQRQAPRIDGRVVAMAAVGKDVLARVVNDDDTSCLLEFRLGSTITPRVQSGPRWWEDATCVDY